VKTNVFISKFNDNFFHVIGHLRARAPLKFIDAPWLRTALACEIFFLSKNTLQCLLIAVNCMCSCVSTFRLPEKANDDCCESTQMQFLQTMTS